MSLDPASPDARSLPEQDASAFFEAAFAAGTAQFVSGDGDDELDVETWRVEATAQDVQLFVQPCTGPTLDIGCGPGRLVAALTDRGIEAMGVDASASAVREARSRGALAVRRNLFDRLPGEGRWQHALLADGNIGIGGRPTTLLRRVGELLAPGGTALVEVAAPGRGLVRERRRLRVDGRLGPAFDWAVVGLDGLQRSLPGTGLVFVAAVEADRRWVATLRRE